MKGRGHINCVFNVVFMILCRRYCTAVPLVLVVMLSCRRYGIDVPVVVVIVVAAPPMAGTGELLSCRYKTANTPDTNNNGLRSSGLILAIIKTSKLAGMK